MVEHYRRNLTAAYENRTATTHLSVQSLSNIHGLLWSHVQSGRCGSQQLHRVEGNGRGLAARLLTDTLNLCLFLLLNEGEEEVGYLMVKQTLPGPVQMDRSTSPTHLHKVQQYLTT